MKNFAKTLWGSIALLAMFATPLLAADLGKPATKPAAAPAAVAEAPAPASRLSCAADLSIAQYAIKAFGDETRETAFGLGALCDLTLRSQFVIGLFGRADFVEDQTMGEIGGRLGYRFGPGLLGYVKAGWHFDAKEFKLDEGFLSVGPGLEFKPAELPVSFYAEVTRDVRKSDALAGVDEAIVVRGGVRVPFDLAR